MSTAVPVETVPVENDNPDATLVTAQLVETSTVSPAVDDTVIPPAGDTALAAEPIEEAPLEGAPEIYEGIDCVTPLHWPEGGYSTLWEYLGAHDEFPSFVGRYIGSFVPSYNLTSPEAGFLHERSCAILVVFDGLTAQDAGGDYEHGVLVGKRAVAAARAVGIPANGKIVLFCDIETEWPVTAGFIAGYHVAVYAGNYLAGCYGNPLNGNFNNAYSNAYNATPAMHNRSWVWSSEPQRFSWDTSPKPAVFAPTRPWANGAKTVVWQYQNDTFHQLIDRDQATAEGYQLMWVPMYRIKTDCSGKPTPDHTSPAVCRIPAGTHVRRLDSEGDWMQVVTPHGFRVWVLKNNTEPLA